jgi:hypothetical protein
VSIKVLYSTKSGVRDAGQPGKTDEVWFDSLDDAKSAPFPDGCISARIQLDHGYWFRSDKFEWEFYKEP